MEVLESSPCLSHGRALVHAVIHHQGMADVARGNVERRAATRLPRGEQSAGGKSLQVGKRQVQRQRNDVGDQQPASRDAHHDIGFRPC